MSIGCNMRHSSLVSFLNGALSGDELWHEIDAEVNDCIAATSKLGGVGRVTITDGSETQVAREHVGTLLTALADAKLPLEAASYIADALIMSDAFEWDDGAVAEALFFLSDESRPLTLADIREAQARLSTAI